MFQWSAVVASICEVPPVALLPNFIVQRKLLKPFRTQTGGTIMVNKIIHFSTAHPCVSLLLQSVIEIGIFFH